MDAYYEAAAQLPHELAQFLLRLPEPCAERVTEIRIRSGRPVCLSVPDGALFISRANGVCTRPEADAVRTPHTLVSECFYAVCGYSVHSFEDAIAKGFVPMPGGHRAGVCGTAVFAADGFALKNITGINVRIARTRLGICPPELLAVLQEPPVGLLVAGAPGSGKTTLLRAVIAALSAAGQKVAVVDERFELLPVSSSGFAAVPPLFCDVLSGYPKHIGMQHALRALGPAVLVCDEVGTMEDVAAIESAANAGVGLVATIHAANARALSRRPQYRALLATGVFDKVAFLQGSQAPGRLAEVCDAGSIV